MMKYFVSLSVGLLWANATDPMTGAIGAGVFFCLGWWMEDRKKEKLDGHTR